MAFVLLALVTAAAETTLSNQWSRSR
jgi:hypothetical protein